MVKNVQNLVNIVCERPLKANPQSQASRGQSQMSLFFLHIFIRVRPRFFDQVGHEMHLVETSIFSLNPVIVRPTKIVNRANKN